MPQYEYLVLPAPEKGQRVKGVRGTKNRFAHALQKIMNEQGQHGWRYLRTDTLPCDERQGLTRRGTSFQNMLVFTREVLADAPVVDWIDEPSDTIPAKAMEMGTVSETVEPDQPSDTEPSEAQDITFQPRTTSLGGVTRSTADND